MSRLREKIVNNGFTKTELLGLARKYLVLKKVYHPELTTQLTLVEVIGEEARQSWSLTKYYLVAVVLSTLIALFFNRADYLFMPIAFLLMVLYDVFSSAKKEKRNIITELKLMLLAIKMRV